MAVPTGFEYTQFHLVADALLDAFLGGLDVVEPLFNDTWGAVFECGDGGGDFPKGCLTVDGFDEGDALGCARVARTNDDATAGGWPFVRLRLTRNLPGWFLDRPNSNKCLKVLALQTGFEPVY